MSTIATVLSDSRVVKAIEKHASTIPAHYLLWGGVGMLAASVTFHMFNRTKCGKIFGQLASPLLMLGVYNKQVQDGNVKHPGKQKNGLKS